MLCPPTAIAPIIIGAIAVAQALLPSEGGKNVNEQVWLVDPFFDFNRFKADGFFFYF